jgi:hypothetical protein
MKQASGLLFTQGESAWLSRTWSGAGSSCYQQKVMSMTTTGAEIRLHGIPRKPNESIADYHLRANEIEAARQCRAMWFGPYMDRKRIAMTLDRSEEWVRDVITYRIHATE